ncbi:hypothetical protein ACFL5O_02855 [Myxococcota bacterium]
MALHFTRAGIWLTAQGGLRMLPRQCNSRHSSVWGRGVASSGVPGVAVRGRFAWGYGGRRVAEWVERVTVPAGPSTRGAHAEELSGVEGCGARESPLGLSRVFSRLLQSQTQEPDGLGISFLATGASATG